MRARDQIDGGGSIPRDEGGRLGMSLTRGSATSAAASDWQAGPTWQRLKRRGAALVACRAAVTGSRPKGERACRAGGWG